MTALRLKIAWFTPFHRKSSIGQFSQAVTHELSSQAQVDLWVAETDNLLETSLRVVPYASISHYEEWLGEYDYVVYNLGDHCANHWRIYEASQRHQGIVVLHDFVMHNFFVGYYRKTGHLERYCEVMKRWYGIADLKVVDSDWSGPFCRVWERDEVIKYPLFEEAIVGALGVIVHSGFLRERVSHRSFSPVTKIHLAHAVDRTSSELSRADLGVPADRLLLTTIGHLNRNKRIETTLRVIAADRDLRSRVFYLVVGPFDTPYGQRIQELCRELELQDVVSFTGYAEEPLLRAALAHADVCINLRWPAMEGASGSIVWEMLFGRATVVTDTGIYSELPDDCVSKVRPDHELCDLRGHLRNLVFNESVRLNMGQNALRFATEHFTPQTYVSQFLAFCSELAVYQPAFRLAELVAGELKAIGVTAGMAIVDTVARQSAALLDGEWDPPILRNPGQ